jgi:hypothetical protein
LEFAQRLDQAAALGNFRCEVGRSDGDDPVGGHALIWHRTA